MPKNGAAGPCEEARAAERQYAGWHRAILSAAADLTGREDAAEDGAGYAGLKEQTVRLLGHLRSAMFPQIFGAERGGCRRSDACALSLQSAFILLQQTLRRVMPPDAEIEETALALIRALPEIKRVLLTDVEAAYEGDPAAKSVEEVMLTYPAFEAISIFRLAHELYAMGIPILPRMMTEYAHQRTGIDIHPGATVGPYFFIDHGTGVVIGETTTIGRRVKLYQGVTLGAKSFAVNADGSLVKGVKRHPDIGSDVVVYAGATILGGQTRIGDGCVIGGNVWLTHSVKAGETVLAAHGAQSRDMDA